MKKIIQSHKMNSREIGIHLTPITGFSPVNTTSDCNHSTPLAFQFNVLRAVTELHIGETNEN